MRGVQITFSSVSASMVLIRGKVRVFTNFILEMREKCLGPLLRGVCP